MTGADNFDFDSDAIESDIESSLYEQIYFSPRPLVQDPNLMASKSGIVICSVDRKRNREGYSGLYMPGSNPFTELYLGSSIAQNSHNDETLPSKRDKNEPASFLAKTMSRLRGMSRRRTKNEDQKIEKSKGFETCGNLNEEGGFVRQRGKKRKSRGCWGGKKKSLRKTQRQWSITAFPVRPTNSPLLTGYKTRDHSISTHTEPTIPGQHHKNPSSSTRIISNGTENQNPRFLKITINQSSLSSSPSSGLSERQVSRQPVPLDWLETRLTKEGDFFSPGLVHSLRELHSQFPTPADTYSPSVLELTKDDTPSPSRFLSFTTHCTPSTHNK